MTTWRVVITCILNSSAEIPKVELCAMEVILEWQQTRTAGADWKLSSHFSHLNLSTSFQTQIFNLRKWMRPTTASCWGPASLSVSYQVRNNIEHVKPSLGNLSDFSRFVHNHALFRHAVRVGQEGAPHGPQQVLRRRLGLHDAARGPLHQVRDARPGPGAVRPRPVTSDTF